MRVCVFVCACVFIFVHLSAFVCVCLCVRACFVSNVPSKRVEAFFKESSYGLEQCQSLLLCPHLCAIKSW